MTASHLTDAEIAAVFDRLASVIPRPDSELVYEDPFTLLVAVVLSAQSTDAGVNKATATLFAEADTPTGLLALGEDGIKRHIHNLGLYNNKARNLIRLCRGLVDDHGGRVPATRAELEKLPGVGRKTANVILNTAFGEPTIAVDTHIYRLCNRTGLAPGTTVRAVEDGLEAVVPARHKKDAHHLLILHGRYTCTARKPKCGACVIHDICRYESKTAPA